MFLATLSRLCALLLGSCRRSSSSFYPVDGSLSPENLGHGREEGYLESLVEPRILYFRVDCSDGSRDIQKPIKHFEGL